MNASVSGLDLEYISPLSEEEMEAIVSGLDLVSVEELSWLTQPCLDDLEEPDCFFMSSSEINNSIINYINDIDIPNTQGFEELLKSLGTESKDGDIRVDYTTEDLVIFDKKIHKWVSILTKNEIHAIYKQKQAAINKKPKCRFQTILKEIEEIE